MAAEVSRDPAAFARKISQNKYISEVNGDNRALYRKSLVSLAKDIESILADPFNPISL
ncbi:MAG: hypothetical protein LUG51_05095 [Tannerellaceae bacterium]|nr:hypothetical protein [Tannerellaceae bacterium]